MSSCYLCYILTTGIQVQSIIFPFLTDRDKQRVLCGLPWQLLIQELQWRFCSEAGCTGMKACPLASTNTHMFVEGVAQKWLYFCVASMPADEWKNEKQVKGDQTSATPCKYVTVVLSLPLYWRSSGPNAHHRWHMAMTGIWGTRSQRSRGRWPCLMGWPIGYECYLISRSKLRKWISFMLTLGWISWGISVLAHYC